MSKLGPIGREALPRRLIDPVLRFLCVEFAFRGLAAVALRRRLKLHGPIPFKDPMTALGRLPGRFGS